MFRIMTHYLKAYKWQVLALMVFQIAQALLALYLPNLNADIINKGVASGSSSEIYRYGAIMLGFSLLQVAAAIVATYFSSRLAMRLAMRSAATTSRRWRASRCRRSSASPRAR